MGELVWVVEQWVIGRVDVLSGMCARMNHAETYTVQVHSKIRASSERTVLEALAELGRRRAG